MKRNILILLLAIYPFAGYCQTELGSRTIHVSFDKTKHIVFPDQVISFSVGLPEYIEADRLNEANHIIRLTTQMEGFSDTTNLMVACSNGEIYSFRICYLPRNILIDDYIIYASDKTQKHYKDIKVNNKFTTHLLFPNNIIYCQHGNEETLGYEFKTNLLTIGTIFDSIPETNIFVVDEKLEVYEVTVKTGKANSYVYNFESKRKYPVNLEVNSIEMGNMISRVEKAKRNIFSVGVIENRLEMSLSNLFVHEDFLFLAFDFKNFSHINYDVDFITCFIRDKKTSKITLIQETEVVPVYQNEQTKKIRGKNKNRLILAFRKFTIPNDKILEIEMYEKNGGRHIKIAILNEYLLAAELLK
jgi:conjugative transposon TraN protein